MYEYKPKVIAIMATCGRHLCSERSLSLFLNQTYDNKHLLIYQNSEIHQVLDKSVDANLVTLVNNSKNLKTGEKYSNLGQIYNDALNYIGDSDVIIFWDDDDLFLPNHIEEGVNGLLKARLRSDRPYEAYKPAQSYYRHRNGIDLVVNTLEPSIFTTADHIKAYGFSETTTAQHLHWLQPLIDTGRILADPEGVPTMFYNWGDEFPTYKTSGDGSQNNFKNYRTFSQDHGDGIISPIDVSNYYKLI